MMRESKALHEIVLASIPDAVFVTDDDGRFVYICPNVDVIFGYSEPEVRELGNISKLLGDDLFRRDELEALGEIRNIECQIKDKAGIDRFLLVHVKRDPIERHTVLYVCRDVTPRRRTQARLTSVNRCFLNFGQDADENIQRLTALCGELLGATCALYNRLDQGMLCSYGQWHTPEGYDPVDRPEGHICYDVIRRGSDQPLVVRNLPQTPYAQTDPNVLPYRLQTYVGQAVKCNDRFVGSVCVVFQKDFIPTEEDVKLMGIIASAIGVEEQREQAETELAAYRDHLEDLVQARTSELTAANRKLEQEIAEREQAEEALQKSETRYRQLVENANDIIWRTDENGQLTYGNATALNLTGYGKEELVGLRFADLARPDRRQAVEDFYRNLFAQEIDDAYHEFPIVTRDGIELWLGQKTQLLRQNGRVVGCQALARDITERKWAEEALKASEARYRSLFDGVPIGIYRTTPKGRFLNANRALAQMVGYPDRESLLEVNAADFYVDPQQRDLWLERMARQNIVRGYASQLRRRDGTTIWVRDNAQAVRDATGQVLYYEGTLENITPQVQAEAQRDATLKALQKSEERWRTYIEQANDFIFTLDASGQLTAVNQAMCRATGYTADELLGNDPLRLLVAPESQAAAERALTSILSQQDIDQFELQILTKRGRRISVEVRGRFLYDDGEFAGTFHIARDITERKQSEKEVRQRTAQLEALRELGLELTAQLELEAVLHSVASRAVELLGGTDGGLYLYRADQDVLEWAVSTGPSPALIGTQLRRGEGLAGKVWDTGEPLFVQDYQHWEGRAEIYEGLPFTSILEAPICWGDTFLGVLNVNAAPPRTFSSTDAELLGLFATQAAIAIRNAQLFEALRESEAKNRAILDALPDLMFILSRDGKHLDLHAPSPDQLYVRPERFLGKHVREVLPAGVAQKYEHHVEQVLKNQATQVFEYQLEIPEKGKRLYEARMVVGSEDSVLAIVRDITERKRAERALRRRAQELSALQATVLDITEALELPVLLLTIVERATSLLGGSGGGLYLRDPAQKQVRCVVSYNTPRDYTGTVLNYGEGAAGLVAQTGEPLLIDDYRTWSRRAAPFEEEEPFSAIASAPMVWQGHTTGVLHVLDDVENRRFDEADLELLTLFANHAALAVENSRLYEQAQQEINERIQMAQALQERNRQLAFFTQAGRAFSSSLELDHVLATVLEEVSRLLDVTACSVWLTEPPTGDVVCRQAAGPNSEIVRGWRLAPGQGVAGWVTEHGESQIVPDTHADPRHYPRVDEEIGVAMRSILSVPLSVQHEVIGALHLVDTEVDRFKPGDLALMEPLATTAAIAIDNARLYEQARQDAKTKSVLLHEVNHRVKNNLSAIIGLIYAEQQKTDTEDWANFQPIMQELIGRVRGLAAVHSLLAESEWAPLRLSDLVARVIRSSLQALPLDKHISVEVPTAPVTVTPSQAHQLALVINELTTNTAKHALETRDSARIAVTIASVDDVIQLQYRDDGPGFPPDVLQLRRKNVGFDLIESVVYEGLQGELKLDNDSGAVTVIRFKPRVADSRA